MFLWEKISIILVIQNWVIAFFLFVIFSIVDNVVSFIMDGIHLNNFNWLSIFLLANILKQTN